MPEPPDKAIIRSPTGSQLGEHASPLASALASHTGTVEAFIAEVESRNRVPLR